METEKAERLRILLQEALQPLVEKVDRLEKEILSLKKGRKDV
ncbi:MAG TPA: hypothetical protein VFK44_02255 [Bacillales bacterium]|nr:hypothetical protein [Bacillales bacterium]